MPGVVLMENAARSAADVIHSTFPDARSCVIVCGPGNNGGDGFALARQLVVVGRITPTLCVLVDDSTFTGDAAINLKVVRAMKLPTISLREFDSLDRGTLVIDAIFGTGLTRAAEGVFAAAIAAVNRFEHIVALDVPSGLDVDTGRPTGPCVRAGVTVTFFSGKVGFESAGEFTGEVVVGSIGVPAEAIAGRLGLKPASTAG